MHNPFPILFDYVNNCGFNPSVSPASAAVYTEGIAAPPNQVYPTFCVLVDKAHLTAN